MQITGAKSLRNNSANKFRCRRWIPLSFNVLYAQRHNEKWPWFIVCRENLHRKPFQQESTEKSFLFFLVFFFLFFSRVSKITPTVVAADVAAAISPCAAITTRSQMKAPQMQFAVTFALSTSQAGICKNSLLHAISRALFLERQAKCGHKSTNMNINSLDFRNYGH